MLTAKQLVCILEAGFNQQKELEQVEKEISGQPITVVDPEWHEMNARRAATLDPERLHKTLPSSSADLHRPPEDTGDQPPEDFEPMPPEDKYEQPARDERPADGDYYGDEDGEYEGEDNSTHRASSDAAPRKQRKKEPPI